MPSASAGGEKPSLPPSLRSDHIEFARRLGPWLANRPDGPDVFDLLTRYGAIVHEQSQRLSLVAYADRSSLYTRHVLDSLNPVSLFEEAVPQSVLDLGSGAGFPGIPLAIVWPTCKFVLVESREKKAGFLERAVRDLGLRNVAIACSRIEDLDPVGFAALPAGASFIRAVGDLPAMLTSLARVSAVGTPWVYFLGGGQRAETTLKDLDRAGVDHRVATGEFGGRLLRGTIGAV